MNVLHNALQFLIHLSRSPLQAHGVLTHFKSRYSHTTSVGSLTRPIKDLTMKEDLNGFRSGSNVGALCPTNPAVASKSRSIPPIQYVRMGPWRGRSPFALH